MDAASEAKRKCTGKPVNLTNGFGLYIHVPFCVHKCSYCDFYSFTQYEQNDFERLIEKLQVELCQMAALLGERGSLRPLDSLFVGGGTPSLLPPHLMGKLCFEALKRFEPAEDIEISMEANPETIDASYLRQLTNHTPINRISLGAQSFYAKHLKSLERLGGAESICRAVDCLQGEGIENYNLDLITAIPGQSEKEFLSDIDRAISLEPKHISFYTLTLKDKHPLAGALPSDEQSARLYESGISRLLESGFEQYEISNFSKPGFQCVHNLLYWSGGDFLGVGPSAASRFFWGGNFHHKKQSAHFETYLAIEDFGIQPFVANTKEQTKLEASFLELRKNVGVDIDYFEDRYGHNPTHASLYSKLLESNLVEARGSRLRLTAKGRLLADSVTSALADH